MRTAEWHSIRGLSRKQEGLLKQIFARTLYSQRWCPQCDLAHEKTAAGQVSLSRSLRRLEARGLIEKRLDENYHPEVRLAVECVRRSQRGTFELCTPNPW
jgi:hypothetical protein